MILVNNLSRFKIDTEKVKLKVLKIFKFMGVFPAQSRSFVLSRRRTGRGIDHGYLEINFLAPGKMSELHEKFMKKSGPTTIISIEAGKNFPIGGFSDIGEIYLCPQEIKKSGLGLEYFLVHGILHLYGYDHKTKKGEAVMLEKEKQICAKMGL